MAFKLKKFIGQAVGAATGSSLGSLVGGPIGTGLGTIGGVNAANAIAKPAPRPEDPRMEMGLKLKQQLLGANIPDVERQKLISKLLPEGTGDASLIDLGKLDEVTAELSKLTGIADESVARASEMATILTRQPGRQQTLLSGGRR